MVEDIVGTAHNKMWYGNIHCSWSYGSNGDAVFFFLTDGSYMEWNGTYLLVDRPMKLSVKPMVYSEDK